MMPCGGATQEGGWGLRVKPWDVHWAACTAWSQPPAFAVAVVMAPATSRAIEPGPAATREAGQQLDAAGVAALGAGNLTEAVLRFRAALAVREQGVAQHPGQFAWRRDVIVSYQRLGDVLGRTADMPGALDAYQHALDETDRLRADRPDDPMLARDRYVALFGLSTIRQAAGDLATALQLGQEALRQIDADTGELAIRDRMLMANRIAHLQRMQGDTTATLATLQAALDRLPQSRDASWQALRSAALLSMGDAYEERGEAAAAEGSYRAALDSARLVQAAGPDDPAASGPAAHALRMLGQYLTRQKRFDEALAANQAANTIHRRIAARAPDDQQAQAQLAMSFILVGDDQREMGRGGDALASYSQAVEILQRLTAANPADTSMRRTLSVTLGRLAIVAAAKGELAKAVAYNRQCIETAKQLSQADPSNAVWQADVAFTLARQVLLLRQVGDGPGAEAALQDGLHIMRELVKDRPYNAGWITSLKWFEAEAAVPPALRLLPH